MEVTLTIAALSTYDVGVLSFGALIAGIWILVLGGDWAVCGAVALARRLQLSPMFIGATIIAFGTSVPELFTSVNANLQDYPGIALGNVVGSNIANILLVIGATALVTPLAVCRHGVRRDLIMMLVATTILILGMHAGVFTRAMGAGMFALLAGFVIWQYRSNSIDVGEVEEVEADLPAGRAVLMLLGGFVALAVGAELLVKGAATIGRVAGVPDAVIGVTAVALGTSLPELAASVAAAARRETDMIFGNIIGSNTFNILSIVGLTAMIKPLESPPELMGFDMWAMAAVSAGFALWLMMWGRVPRAAGMGLVAGYVGFTLIQFGPALGL